MNKVILMGRLTKDVELRQTPSGVCMARFTIAVNRRFADKDGTYRTDFINCVAWRQTAEFIARYFQKGNMLGAAGSIITRSWDDKDGKRCFSTEVNVDEAYFTGKKSENAYSQVPTAEGYNQQGQDDGYNEFADFFDGSEEDIPF